MEILYFSLLIFFVAGVIVEYQFAKKKKPGYYNFKDVITTVKLGFAGLFLDLFAKALAFYLFYKMQPYAFFELNYKWWVWILCFLTWDFIFYLKHFSEHRIRLLWAIHINHHSSKYLNLSTALRSGVLKSVYRYFYFAPMVLLGFPFEMFLFIYAVGKFWAFFSHSQLIGKLGFFEKILVTPSHHRVHHSCNENNLDRNFGETLIIWDKMMNTFKEEDGELQYGIYEDIGNDFVNAAFHEMKSLKNDVKKAKGLLPGIAILFSRPSDRRYDKVKIPSSHQTG